jgi:hypothetical protein
MVTEADLKNLMVVKLKDLLKARNLPLSGKKQTPPVIWNYSPHFPSCQNSPRYHRRSRSPSPHDHCYDDGRYDDGCYDDCCYDDRRYDD